MTQELLNISALNKSYGKHRALQDIHFNVYAGEVIAVLGQNGAGKTSLINSVLGLQHCTFEALEIFGQAVVAQNRPIEIRQRIGVMMQMGSMNANLTVAEQVDLFCSYYPHGYHAEELIALMQLESIAKQRFGKLSGGQRQQLLFALALAGKPKLVFLDEPSVGMDVEARHILWAHINRLRDAGCGVLLTTHYIEEAERLSDRVVMIRNGCMTPPAPVSDWLVGHASLEEAYLNFIKEQAHA